MSADQIIKNGGNRSGFDGPVAVVLPGTVEWQKDAKTLAALIQDTAPVGRGALKKDLSLRRGRYKRLPKPRVGFEALIRNSYAHIQDQGGHIPARFPKGYMLTSDDGQTTIGPRAGKALAFGGPVGGPHKVFAKRCGPFDIQGTDYIRRGYERWLTSRGHRAAFGTNSGPTVRWAEDQREVP